MRQATFLAVMFLMLPLSGCFSPARQLTAIAMMHTIQIFTIVNLEWNWDGTYKYGAGTWAISGLRGSRGYDHCRYYRCLGRRAKQCRCLSYWLPSIPKPVKKSQLLRLSVHISHMVNREMNPIQLTCCWPWRVHLR